MTLPTVNYPLSLDSNENLYEVHDGLRVVLSEDYNPGDESIAVIGDITRFPQTGIITLTEQASDINERAISFYYTSHDDVSFSGLTILSEFTDVLKPKNITNITQNVMAQHHNNLKDSLIAIETFIGTKGTEDVMPFGDTLEGRVNFLRRLVLTPRAWFTCGQTTGRVPFEVTFRDRSYRLGTGETMYLWDFGDGGVSSTTSNISSVTSFGSTNISVTKTYNKPGKYDVTLTVTNEHGSDVVQIKELVNARIDAPQEAKIEFVQGGMQLATSGCLDISCTCPSTIELPCPPLFDRLGNIAVGPYTQPPTIRALANTVIDVAVPTGGTGDYNYAGEWLDGDGNIIDAITSWTWYLGDDLTHQNSMSTKASYSIGGVYDIKLRADTQYGSYRISNYENVIDIIERKNMWLFNRSDSTGIVKANEFGLLCETFKVATKTFIADRDDAFLDGIEEEERAKEEFKRNTMFSPISTTSSGERGSAVLAWAQGGTSSSWSSQKIRKVTYEGFSDTYSLVSDLDSTNLSNRAWNWVALPIDKNVFFLFGADSLSNNVNKSVLKYDLETNTLSGGSTSSLGSGGGITYENGAEELQENIGDLNFSVYRTCTKAQTGYIIRNSGVGDFFRLGSFYKTFGTITDPVQGLSKLSDVSGTTKYEGQIVALSSGIFFFDNSGNISAYNESSGVWETGGPSTISSPFKSLQDYTVTGFDNLTNTLLATSDGDRNAYLSYDYSVNAFIKFNTADMTFSALPQRPVGEQWIMGVY